MNLPRQVIVLGLLTVLSLPTSGRTQEGPRPVYPPGKREVQVQSIKRIWSEAVHNAFPDLHYFQGRWYVALREGTVHGESGFGRVRIISSADGEKWQSVALFEGFGDYRHPALSVTPDNRLLVISKFNIYTKAGENDKRRLKAVDHQEKTHAVVTDGHEDRVAFSADGVRWTTMQAVRGTQPGCWFWSGVHWHKGIGYAIDRQFGDRSTLYRTMDGLNFEPLTKEVPAGNESRHAFLPDGTMIAFFRDGRLASSPPPYQKWALNKTNQQGPHSHAGPCLLALPNGEAWAACRYRGDRQAFDLPANKEFLEGTALFKLVDNKLVAKLLIPGSGDAGYNGMAWRDGFLWLAYNAPSPEAGAKSSIFLARIKPVE